MTNATNRLVYVAGPMTTGNIGRNIRDAMVYANTLLNHGLYPFVPHLNFFWDMHFNQPYEKWMEYDFQWLQICNAVYRMPGDSPGGDREVALAWELCIPVYTNINKLIADFNPAPL